MLVPSPPAKSAVESNIYRNNIDYIYSKYDGTRVDKDLLWMIGKITENKDMIELSEIKEGESVDMCDAWKKFYEKARQEGFTYKVYRRRIQRSVI